VETILRLVSLVWEICLSATIYEGVFQPGLLLVSIVKPVVQRQRTPLQVAKTKLDSWSSRLNLGANYRNACHTLRSYRGGIIEDDVRSAVSNLSRWSLSEIFSLAFELSPLFYSSEFRLLDSTLCNMSEKAPMFSTLLIRKALEHACPVIFDIRSAMRLGPGGSDPFHVRSNHFLETLNRIPKIRAWREAEMCCGGGTTTMCDEVVLTNDDLNKSAASSDLIGQLRDLSARRTLVSYGKAPSYMRAELGYKRVFTFNCFDLRKLYDGTI
jgi:hypothetical protein